MQRRLLHDLNGRRRQAQTAVILAFCLLPLLGGCLPGMDWGGDSEFELFLSKRRGRASPEPLL